MKLPSTFAGRTRRQMRQLATLILLILLILSSTAAVALDVRSASTFTTWRAKNEPSVSQFQAHLESEKLHQVMELRELLKSSSSWQTCNAEPYAVPPQERWSAVLSVLRLIRELTRQGVLGVFTVHSAYRGPELNTCSGGAAGSAHHRAFAVDITPADGEDPTSKLCNFWRDHGRHWAMGFSRYPSGRVHIDTAGYRTWGSDRTGKSAVCGGA
jgi:uncharacterized protein YcbK (DUF882 family)